MKTRNIFLVMVLVMLSFSQQLFAAEIAEKTATDEKIFETNFSSKIFSKYVGDTGTVFYNHPVVQNDLTISHKSGMYFDLWVSTSLKNAGVSTNYGNEIDYTIGWAGELSGIGIDAGVSYWDIVTLFKMPEDDIIQPYLELNKKFNVIEGHVFTPSIRVEYAIPARGNDASSKVLHIHSALKHGWEISKEVSLSQKVILTYDNGAYGADKALVGAYEFNPSYKVASWLALDGSAKVISPFTHVNDGRKTEWIFGAGLSTSF